MIVILINPHEKKERKGKCRRCNSKGKRILHRVHMMSNSIVYMCGRCYQLLLKQRAL